MDDSVWSARLAGVKRDGSCLDLQKAAIKAAQAGLRQSCGVEIRSNEKIFTLSSRGMRHLCIEAGVCCIWWVA
jgi:hypothetical protein